MSESDEIESLRARVAALEASAERHRRTVEARSRDLVAANEELNQLIDLAFHDLGVPLTSILGYSRDLGMSLEDMRGLITTIPPEDPLQAEFEALVEGDMADRVGLIQDISTQMDRVIRGVLTLSQLRRREITPARIDVQSLVESLISSLPRAQRALARMEVLGELPHCVGDADLLKQLFEQLIDNAFGFLDDNRPGHIRISARAEGRRAVYSIEDNGIGVGAEHTESVFELFHQLRGRPQPGAGLGLAIVRRIVAMHEGDIRAEPGDPHGTRFVLTLHTDADAFV